MFLRAAFKEVIHFPAGGTIALDAFHRVKVAHLMNTPATPRTLRKVTTALDSLIVRNPIDIVAVLLTRTAERWEQALAVQSRRYRPI